MDVNSGAAPQPGGYAGPQAAEVGHAVPNAETAGIPVPTEEELATQVGEAQAQQQADAEKTLADYGLRQDILGKDGEDEDAEGVEVPEGDLESRLQWVSEGADLEEKQARAEAVYQHEQEADPDVDLAELSGRLTAAVYGDQGDQGGDQQGGDQQTVEVGTEAPEGTDGTEEAPANSRAPQRTEPEPEPEDYAGEQWNHDALKAEIDKRNEDREDDARISKAGSSDDLRARLAEDDRLG